MSKISKARKSIIFPIVICFLVMFAIPVFAYQGSGGTVSFTLDNTNTRYSNRNASSSWNAPKKDYVVFSSTKTNNATGKTRTIQCVEQKTTFDHVVLERNGISGSVTATPTSSYHDPNNNRTFAYAEYDSGVYAGKVKVTW